MPAVKMEDLKTFVKKPVQVSVYGGPEEDQAPWIPKQVYAVELCPDQTHLRIYFDYYYFLAVPLTSTVIRQENEWTAYDETCGLYYSIKSEGNRND